MPNTHSLKVGDQVRVVRPYDQWLEVGKVYEVSHLWERHPTSISIIPPTRGAGLFSVSYFEKVEPPTAKYRVRKNGGSFIVERRVDSFQNVTAAIPEAEAKVICDALNAAEVA
jgi:hypothetical protein